MLAAPVALRLIGGGPLETRRSPQFCLSVQKLLADRYRVLGPAAGRRPRRRDGGS